MVAQQAITPSTNRSKFPAFWEMDSKPFEEMCLALAHAQSDLTNIDFFGINGQPQFGVDIVGHRPDGSGLDAISCKSQKAVIARDIRTFVSEFLDHWDPFWSQRDVRRYVLALAAPLDNRQVRNEIDIWVAHFRSLGVSFETWGPTKLQEMLRPYAGIVQQYLGSYFVEILCGAGAAGLVKTGMLTEHMDLSVTSPSAWHGASVHDAGAHWNCCYVGGSTLVLEQGVAGTALSAAGHHREFFCSDNTAVLGTLDPAVMETFSTTRATWTISVSQNNRQLYDHGYLAIGCIRYYGGLHSREYDRVASLSINGAPLDRIMLRIKPDDHSDFFCQMPTPRGFPDIKPFSHCLRLYVWPILITQLASVEKQTVTVEIDSHANWDIDYVGFVFKTTVRA